MLSTAINSIIDIESTEASHKQRVGSYAANEGMLIGISGGAALYAALELAGDPAYANKNIVVVLPDTGERYLSGYLFEN